MAKILITGGTGFLGRRLAAKLAEEGHTVVVTSRNPASAPFVIPKGAPGGAVDIVEWDYQAGPPSADALSGLHAVFHLMGEGIADGRWSDERKHRLRESRITSTKTLLQALPDSVEFLLSASAIAYYPSSESLSYTEEWAGPPQQNDFLGGLVHDWEAEAGKAPCRVVTLRIGLVLGEGGLLKRLLPIFRMGLGGRLGQGHQWMSWIHADDLVRMMIFAMNQKISGPLNGTAPEPVTNDEFTRTLAEAVHRPAFFGVPEFALKLAMGEASEIALSSQRVLPAKAAAAGFAFQFPTLASALEDLTRA